MTHRYIRRRPLRDSAVNRDRRDQAFARSVIAQAEKLRREAHESGTVGTNPHDLGVQSDAYRKSVEEAREANRREEEADARAALKDCSHCRWCTAPLFDDETDYCSSRCAAEAGCDND